MDLFWRPISLFSIILLTSYFKRHGIFPEESGTVITKVALNFTIPATILCSFQDYSSNMHFASTALLFLTFTLLSLGLFSLLYLKSGEDLRMFAMMNTTGYNIGSFALPLIRCFYGDSGVIVACMADLGNSVMVNGGTYALTCSLLNRKSDSRGFLRDLIKHLICSPPFVAYLILLPFLAFKWHLPAIVNTFLSPVADANSFVCMAMVGFSMEGRLDWAEIRKIAPLLVQRFCFGAITAVCTYCFLPFDQMTRQVLALLCISPISGLVIVNTRRYGGDIARSGLLVTASIFAGMVGMLILASLFQFF